jgi:hypothetical protein
MKFSGAMKINLSKFSFRETINHCSIHFGEVVSFPKEKYALTQTYLHRWFQYGEVVFNLLIFLSAFRILMSSHSLQSVLTFFLPALNFSHSKSSGGNCPHWNEDERYTLYVSHQRSILDKTFHHIFDRKEEVPTNEEELKKKERKIRKEDRHKSRNVKNAKPDRRKSAKEDNKRKNQRNKKKYIHNSIKRY